MVEVQKQVFWMVMKPLGIAIVLILAAVVLKTWLEMKIKRREGATPKESDGLRRAGPRLEQFRRKRVMTEHERKLWASLYELCKPLKLIALSQVGFSAFIDAGDDFPRIAQKRADFVICTEQMDVLAVIELDDSSHRDKEGDDAARDKMVRAAGIEAIRYERLPEREALLRDLMRLRKSAGF